MVQLMEPPARVRYEVDSVQNCKTQTVSQTIASKGARQRLKRWLWIADLAALPAVFLATCLLKLVRIPDIQLLPFSQWAFDRLRVFPIKKHYYEPYIDVKKLNNSMGKERELPGIAWNDAEQLRVLDRFNFNDELLQLPVAPTGKKEFHFANSSFGPGDAEYLYNVVRLYRPARIVEIGSGNSTLMVRNAIRQNQREDADYTCDHVCIEPFEQSWLEQLGLSVIRKPIEEVDPRIVTSLDADDLLFIDSSHLLSPGGDVVTEFLKLMPLLKSGVIVHVHDIFSPADYPRDWVLNKRLFLNEQYLLEAFLTFNSEFRVLAALNYLNLRHPRQLREKCPRMTDATTPSSFYLVRN